LKNLQEEYKENDLIKVSGGHVVRVSNVFTDFLNGDVISPTKSRDKNSQLKFGGCPRVERHEIQGVLIESELNDLKNDIEAFINFIPEDAVVYLAGKSKPFKNGFIEYCKGRLRFEYDPKVSTKQGTPEHDAFYYGIETAKKYFTYDF
jgi:hypothetical protein